MSFLFLYPSWRVEKNVQRARSRMIEKTIYTISFSVLRILNKPSLCSENPKTLNSLPIIFFISSLTFSGLKPFFTSTS